MKKVYLVISGEKYEASSVDKCFTTKAKAIKYVETLVKDSEYKQIGTDKITWWCGIDYIEIKVMEVE